MWKKLAAILLLFQNAIMKGHTKLSKAFSVSRKIITPFRLLTFFIYVLNNIQNKYAIISIIWNTT